MSDMLSNLEEFGRIFRSVMEGCEKEQEAFWNGLSKEEQLKAFCAVVRRIHKGEIEEGGTYRYVLYDTFGFDLEAYAQAQCAGYLNIHNMLGTNSDAVKQCIDICENYPVLYEDPKNIAIAKETVQNLVNLLRQHNENSKY